MDLPAKTSYSLTYLNAKPAEVLTGAVHLFSTQRFIISNALLCLVFALLAASKVSLITFLATFISYLMAAAFVLLFACICGTFLHTITIMFLSKLNVSCTTVIDENGIRDTLWPVKFNYKWHQIHDVEIKNGSVYVIALFNGIHIPSYAFVDRAEAEDFYALAKQYQAAARQKINQITAARDLYVPDSDFLIRTLQAEEEAKWREIEKRHKEQNRE